MYDLTAAGRRVLRFSTKHPTDRAGSEFVNRAIENNLLIIPGNIFSQHDTHFRISYAASDEMIDRGAEILRNLV